MATDNLPSDLEEPFSKIWLLDLEEELSGHRVEAYRKWNLRKLADPDERVEGIYRGDGWNTQEDEAVLYIELDNGDISEILESDYDGINKVNA